MNSAELTSQADVMAVLGTARAAAAQTAAIGRLSHAQLAPDRGLLSPGKQGLAVSQGQAEPLVGNKIG